MPTLPAQSNPINLPTGLTTANSQPVANAEELRSALASPPSAGNSVEDWLQYLAGQRAVLDKAIRDAQAAIDALEQTAPRAATHDWRGILNTHPGWGGLGFAWSADQWTAVDASVENFTTAVYEHPNAGVPTVYILLQVPRTLDIDRLRLLHNSTPLPGAGTSWAAFTGTVENATGTDNYYVLVRDSDSAQHGITMAQADTITLQEDHGTPASVWIPDGTVTADMLDADNATKQAAFRTAINVDEAGTGGGGALTDDSVMPRHLDADDATKQAAFRARLGLVTSQGHTITDNSILPAWLQADNATQKLAMRTRINARAVAPTITISVGWADNAAGTSPRETSNITVPVGEPFRYFGDQAMRRDHRFLVMPSASYAPFSIIGEGGQLIDEWTKQSDNVTWSMGPLGQNGRDPETFLILIEPVVGG